MSKMMQQQTSQDVVDTSKDDLLTKMREALTTVGLDEYEVDSISLYVKMGPRKAGPRTCPSGKPAVWKPVRRPDGVVYEWVCE